MKLKLKWIICLVVVIFLLIFVILIHEKKYKSIDRLEYNGKTYTYLDIDKSVFDYNFNANGYYEIEMIHEISHDKWDLIYCEGDLFIYETQLKEAKKYYGKDTNYKWSVIVEENEIENEFTLELTESELNYLYNIENNKKEDTMLFEKIEKFGTIKKLSKDKTIYATISLAYFNNYWYYRTFTIDVNKENDPEYVIKLPKTLNKKINSLIDEGDIND